ncbi:hypothetical protein [Gracilimonas sediminicola]|uniref:Uncharacterized protein n=1 Tax=Gracilimonas sediminicola TaxID=2952158 RepID=A0A9X2L0P2_9BACT|nr:hypothetical protein [Gracilimonas sediminicola]MCP9290019.1 hypothetical protein [Gracilimonas sediminicola]
MNNQAHLVFNEAKDEGRLTLSFYDRNGEKLKFGDIVALSDGKNLKFYCEVTYLEDQKAIAPFHTFSFHSVIKVDSVPESAVKSEVEKRYDMWYDKAGDEDLNASEHDKYLMSWLECERLLENRMFRVELTGGN